MGRRSTGTLDLHGAHYRLRVQVPKHLRCRFGGQHSLVETLPTDSKALATRMKAGVVEAMLNKIRQVERELLNRESNGPVDTQMAFAEWMRKVAFGERVSPIKTQMWVLEPSSNRRAAFTDVMLGKATSIELLLPTYM